MAASGELLTLLWDPSVPPLAWGRGRASVLKFEISRGPGRPAEWTGFVPTAGLVHSPRSVFERAIHLTGRVGSEPPTFARTMASTGRADDRRGVSLEVAMVFQPTISSGSGRGGSVAGMAQRDVNITAEKRHKSDLAQSPFHPDVRRIPCEAGELVAHCLRARNLRSSRTEEWEQRDAHPEVHLTAVPDGGEVATSTPYMEPGGRHPVWGQVRVGTRHHWVKTRRAARVERCASLALPFFTVSSGRNPTFRTICYFYTEWGFVAAVVSLGCGWQYSGTATVGKDIKKERPGSSCLCLCTM